MVYGIFWQSGLKNLKQTGYPRSAKRSNAVKIIAPVRRNLFTRLRVPYASISGPGSAARVCLAALMVAGIGANVLAQSPPHAINSHVPNPAKHPGSHHVLDDQDALAKIAIDDVNEQARIDAAGRIQNLPLLESVVQKQSPAKRSHMGTVLALRKLLYETGFADRLGPVQIRMSWGSFPRNFSWTKGPGGSVKTVSVNIEKVKIVVLNEAKVIAEASWNYSGRYAETWNSPLDIGTIPAPIAFCDLLPGLWSAGLNSGHITRAPTSKEITALGSVRNTKFADGIEFIPERVIAARSANQGILGWLYCHNNESDLFVGAVNRLTDQSVLAFTALDMTVPSFEGASPIASNFCNDDRSEHRSMLYENKAWSRITDQDILARIALNETGQYTPRAAIQMLSDRTVLRRISREARDDDTRKAAASKLKSLELR